MVLSNIESNMEINLLITNFPAYFRLNTKKLRIYLLIWGIITPL